MFLKEDGNKFVGFYGNAKMKLKIPVHHNGRTSSFSLLTTKHYLVTQYHL